ncbi:hypothetical protein [Streptomyces sp. NPDC054842]
MTAPHQRTARTGRDVRLLRAAVFAAVCVALAAAGHGIASCAAVPWWSVGAGFLTVFAVAAPLAGRERALPGIAAVLTAGQSALHVLFGLGQGTAMTTASGGSPATGASMTSMASGMSDASLVARAARVVCGASAAAISPAQAQRILGDARIDPHAGHSAAAESMHHSTDAVSAAAGSSMSVLPSLPMLLVHLLAAVAAGWVLRRGDLAVLRLMRLSAHGVAETALVRSLRAALALVRALRAGLPGAVRGTPRAVRTAPPPPPSPRTTALQHSVIRRGPPPAPVFLLAA